MFLNNNDMSSDEMAARNKRSEPARRRADLRAANKRLASLARHLDEEEKQAGRDNRSSVTYDAPVRYSIFAREFHSRSVPTAAGYVTDTKTTRRIYPKGSYYGKTDFFATPGPHNAFENLSAEDIIGLDGYRKLHEACRKKNVFLYITSGYDGGAFINWKQKYNPSTEAKQQPVTRSPAVWKPNYAPRQPGSHHMKV